MAASLLDVNVLVALMWPSHGDHDRVQQWFSRNSHRGWATCPFTEAAFVRIVSNRAFSPDAVSPPEAAALLDANLKHPDHSFWADEISFAQAIIPFVKNLGGHQQVTDAYLLGLAVHKKGTLITMDRSMAALLKSSELRSDLLHVI